MPERSPQQQWLDALEGDRAHAARAASVPADVDKERFKWSLEVLHAFLGTDWLRREIAARAPGHGYLMFGGNQDEEEYPSDQQLRLFRAHSLATDLLGAQNFRGFEQWLEHLPRRSLREAAAELRAIRHMATAGSDVELLTPDPQAGRSPDARFLLDNAEAWVEVKAKEDRPARAFTTNSVTNSLKTAVRQLPDNAPGLVYLQLPYAWGDHYGALPAADMAARSWLRHTGRVNAVVMLLERRLRIAGGGMRFSTAHYTIAHPSPRYPLPSIQGWLGGAGEGAIIQGTDGRSPDQQS